MRVLICGGTGLVGSNILKKLLNNGYTDVHATFFSHKPPEIENVKWYRVDLRKQNDTENLFEDIKPDQVFLVAAKVGGILANSTYPAEFIYDNLAIALNVIHTSYKFGVKKLLNLGSSCIYPKHAPQPMKEEHLLTGSLEPTNEAYAIAKIAAIKLVRYYNQQYGTNYISLMPTNTYGPGDNFSLESSHVLAALIRKFLLAKFLREGNFEAIKEDIKKYPIGFGLDFKINLTNVASIKEVLEKVGITENFLILWGTGEVLREFIFVEDLADACVYMMEKVDADKMKEVSPDYFVNIGTGNEIKLKELAVMIKELVGFNGDIRYDISKPDGTPRKLLDISKSIQLGWHPKTSLEEGISKTIQWYLKNINRDF